jgi:hypothetical protein
MSLNGPSLYVIATVRNSRVFGVGRAESGRRPNEGPQSDRIKVGPDSYVGLDHFSVGALNRGVKVRARDYVLWSTKRTPTA